MLEKEKTNSKDFIASVGKALSILSSFDTGHPYMTLTEVANRVGMSRPTARRFLLTLVELGYLINENRKYHLTPKVLDLGYAFMASVPVVDVITPMLKDLTAQTGEISAFGVLDRDNVVFLAHSSPDVFIASGATIGTTRPAHCTAAGRILVAYWEEDKLKDFFKRVVLKAQTKYTITKKKDLKAELEKIREQGYCLVDQENQLGTRGLAVPVFNSADIILGAIVVVVNSAAVSCDQLEKDFLPRLFEATRMIRERLPLY